MNTTKVNPRGTDRKTAAIVIVLFILGTVPALLSLPLALNTVNAPDHLTAISTNEGQMILFTEDLSLLPHTILTAARVATGSSSVWQIRLKPRWGQSSLHSIPRFCAGCTPGWESGIMPKSNFLTGNMKLTARPASISFTVTCAGRRRGFLGINFSYNPLRNQYTLRSHQRENLPPGKP
jgi:hypothetical protein